MDTDGASAPQPEATNSGSQPKRGRGKRSANIYPKDTVYVIREVGRLGEPLEPKHLRAKWRNAIGALVRDELNPAIPTWKEVPADTKKVLWDKLMTNFRFPAETEEMVRRHAMKQIGESWRGWKSSLNVKYVQKGLTPFKEFGNITPGQWERFVAQKTSAEALALSARNTERAKKNVHHHHLGPGGYYGKEEQFRKIEEDAASTGTYNLQGVSKRTRNWILSRNKEASKALKFSKPETEETVSKILNYAEQRQKGLFKPSRERDELSLALGNPEHTGRVRGLGKRVIWKEGFEKDRHMYKKHDRDREANLEVQVKALVAKALQEQGLSTEARTVMPPLGQLALVGSPPEVRSSQGSTAATTAVDRIREPTPCTLVVLMGRQSNMIEVATGEAHPPGGTYHTNRIPPDYTRVEIQTVKPEFSQWRIDFPTPEGLQILGEVVNQFVLWHKRDIILTTITSPVQTPLRMEGVHEGEIQTPHHDQQLPEMQTPPPRDDVPHDMPPSSPLPGGCVEPTHEQQEAAQQHEEHAEQVDAPEGAHGEPEIRKKHPIKIRPAYVPMTDVVGVERWYGHDMFKPENQAPRSEKAVTSKRQQVQGQAPTKTNQVTCKYVNVECITWSKNCPQKYERGKCFLPNRVIQYLPIGMKRFHDWYLRAIPTKVHLIEARFPPMTFGGPIGQIAFDFDDIHTIFRLGEMETNLIRVWCL